MMRPDIFIVIVFTTRVLQYTVPNFKSKYDILIFGVSYFSLSKRRDKELLWYKRSTVHLDEDILLYN